MSVLCPLRGTVTAFDLYGCRGTNHDIPLLVHDLQGNMNRTLLQKHKLSICNMNMTVSLVDSNTSCCQFVIMFN